MFDRKRFHVETDDPRTVVERMVLHNDIDVVEEIRRFMILIPDGKAAPSLTAAANAAAAKQQ
jgi:hypothetical protein